MNRVNPLHLLKHLFVEEVLAEQNRRGPTGSRWTLQTNARVTHAPRQHIAIQGYPVVGIRKGLRAQSNVGSHQGQLFIGQVESQVQFGVVETVLSQVHNGLDPCSAKLIRAQHEQVGPTLYQNRIASSEIQGGRQIFIALAQKLCTTNSEPPLKINTWNNVRHGQSVHISIESRVLRRLHGRSCFAVSRPNPGFVDQLTQKWVGEKLGSKASRIHSQARRL